MLSAMSEHFGQKLRKHRESRGLSGNRLAQLSGISQANLNGIELGRRPASDANLEALANVRELGLSLDELRAWAAMDKIGEEDLGRLMRHVTEQQDELVLLTQRFGRITQALSELEAEEKRLLLGPRDAKVNERLGEIASLIGRHKADLRADSMELRARAAEIDRLLSDLEGR